MDIRDAQREVRSVYIGGFWGQLLYAMIWLASAAMGTWGTPRALILRLSGRPASLSKDNPFNFLGMQVALVAPFSMLLLIPVALYYLNWFFPAVMILVGAHYLPFATLYGMRMFLFLAGILMAEGVLIALYFSRTFTPGAWIAGLTLFVFALIGRSIAIGDARTHATSGIERAV